MPIVDSFTDEIELEGDDLYVLALLDANDDGQCNDGEAWAEATAEVTEDDTVQLMLTLEQSASCPVLRVAGAE